ncbi:MAG: hypothetical protein PQJ58_15175 [Spirochaetales bacterium]|nr:hypothetical protein [Spirochaetales bacterium]
MAGTDLITWEQVKSILSMQDEDQTTTQFIISSVSEQARGIMGRNIVLDSLEEVRHGTGLSTLLLEEYPVKTVSALYIDTGYQYGAESLIDQTDYFVNKKIGQIELFWRTFPKRNFGRSVKIVYEAGFDTVPADIQQAALESVRWNYDRILYDGIGVKNEKAEGVSKSFEVRIPTNAREIFQSYKRPNV